MELHRASLKDPGGGRYEVSQTFVRTHFQGTVYDYKVDDSDYEVEES